MGISPNINNRQFESFVEDPNDGGTNRRVTIAGVINQDIVTETFFGQSNPGTSNTVIYTVPAASIAVFKSIFVCNTSGTNRTYRVFAALDGSTFDATTAVLYDATIEANETKLILSTLTLPAGGAIAVYGSTTDVTFTISGTVTT